MSTLSYGVLVQFATGDTAVPAPDLIAANELRSFYKRFGFEARVIIDESANIPGDVLNDLAEKAGKTGDVER
jgi:hypothetical protein